MTTPRTVAASRSLRLTLATLLAAALVGCGGGGSGSPPPAVGPSNVAPQAAFADPGAAVAGTPAVFDAGSSSDADGDALTYSWSFGDGQRGGGPAIAHVFTAAGTYTVRLTVDDGHGGSHAVTRDVTVAAGPAAQGSVATLALVRDPAGAVLPGVTVTVVGTGATASTGADGRASLAADRGVAVTLKFSKAGYTDQFKTFTLPAQAESGYLEVALGLREAPLTLADAAAGGTLAGKDGARVVFPAGALVDANGAAVSGAVQVAMTPIDVGANPRAFPGRFEGVRGSGAIGPIVSYGTVEFALTQGGAPVQLAPGRKATIEIPVYTGLNADGSAVKVGDTYPLWSLDERTGGWVEEGTGTVVASAATPTGLALRGEVMHFSWWNHDQFMFPPAWPKPKCLVDTNLDGVLEDLTGTGYCWHYGTGPEQPNTGSQAAGRRHAQAAPAPAQRVPSYVAEDFTPVGGGKKLPIPADMDITFHSYAKNGSLFGTKVVRLGADVEQDVVIVLEPVQDNPGTLAVTLPYKERFSMATVGETDRFTFTATAGTTYELLVSRSTQSLIDGSVDLRDAASTSLRSGTFDNAPFSATVTAAASGPMTVAVGAAGAAPGAYVIELRELAATSSCSNPPSLAVPSSSDHAIPAGAKLCFALALGVDEAVEIRNSQQLNARGTVELFAPGGELVASDTFGSNSFDAILLRAGTAQAGSYRLEVSNTATTNGTIVGLSAARLALAGTLGSPASVSFADPTAGGTNERFYLVKPGSSEPLAVRIDANGISQGFQLWSGGLSATTTGSAVRVAAPTPGASPLVSVFRQSSGTAWNYTLSTSHPPVLAKNTDLSLTTPAPGEVQVYRLDGSGGQELGLGLAYPAALSINPVVRVFAPGTGAELVAVNQLYTLPATGLYTVTITNASAGGAPFTLRLNDLAPPETIPSTGTVQRDGTLALGDIRRYALTLTQGRLLAMRLSSSDALDATAQIAGGGVWDGVVTLNTGGVAGTSASSGTRYVQRSEAALLSLASSSRTPGRNTGAFSLVLQLPAPQTATLAAAVAATLAPDTLTPFAFNVTSPGKHLLCTNYAGATIGGDSALGAIVWGPSAPITNYLNGDINGQVAGNFAEALGDLRAGGNTLGFLNKLGSPVTATARLVPIAAPADLVTGAAASGFALLPCERRYLRFAGVAGTAYTVKATATAAGSLRVRKQPPNGDWSVRSDPPLGTLSLGGTPVALTAGVERTVSFTIPANATFGNGTYVIEVDLDGDASGDAAVTLSSP